MFITTPGNTAGKRGVYIIRPARSLIQTKEETKMFEQTFVQGVGEPRKPWTLAASFSGQLVFVGIIVVIPLMQTARIAWAPPVILYTPPRLAPRPVKVEARSTAQTAVAVLRAVFQPPRFTGPTHVPEKIVTVEGIDVAPIILSGQGGSFGTSDGIGLSVGTAIETAKPPAEVVPVKPTKPTSIRASTGVQQAMLIHEVKPVYPPLARTARISGAVRIAAVIARDGTIQHLQLISGHPLLSAAALRAVQQWRYKPTLLSGDPVEVITEIVVNFTLSN